MPRHGYSYSTFYLMWKGMRSRCRNDKRYSCIHVCNEWEDSMVFIAWAKNQEWKPGLELDRIDNLGDYTPDNCRFVTRQQNNSNKRNNVFLTAFGETKTITEWGRDSRTFVSRMTIHRRMSAGWDSERLLTTPAHEKKPSSAMHNTTQGELSW